MRLEFIIQRFRFRVWELGIVGLRVLGPGFRVLRIESVKFKVQVQLVRVQGLGARV